MNLIGQKFHSLLVLDQFPRDGKPDGLRVRCDCGAEKVTCSRSVRRGRSKSCGCLPRAIATRHGASKHLEYGRWNGMVQRCTNPAWGNYGIYGGRGITVCDEWRSDPWTFFSWLEDHGGGEGKQVDRIDNDRGYSPSNCRLVTRAENCRNQRTNRLVVIHGKEMTIAGAAEKYGLPYDRLYQRIAKLGWPPEKAVAA